MRALVDKVSSYWDKSKGLEREASQLADEMEQDLLNRYILLLEKQGESAEDAHDRGGGICLPFPILLQDFDDEDAAIFVTGINIERSVKVRLVPKSEWTLSMTVSGVNKEKGNIDPFGNHLQFSRFPFNRQCVIYKRFVQMGFFDDSRIELFPDV